MNKSLYQDHFGIRENPFSIIPDPHYLYMSQRHQEALAHLMYGINGSGGFVLLTGEVGTGKTTICRALIEHLDDNVDLALILNPKLSEYELLASLCDEMHIPYPADTTSLKFFFDLLTRHLLQAHARGRNPVLMIDEAQNLAGPVIELIRLLTNLETSKKKLLQIILVGQPELNDILARPDQRQTTQRITARYHLMPLELVECQKYIRHRLGVAGLDENVFSTSAVKIVHMESGGIPRLINSICDRALLAAYVEGHKYVDKSLARGACAEVLGGNVLPSKQSVWSSLALVLVILGLMLWIGLDPFHTGVKEKISNFISSYQQTPSKSPPSNSPTVKPHANIQYPNKTSSQHTTQDISRLQGTSLDRLIQAGTPDFAFQDLFSLWKHDFNDLKGLSPCDKAQNSGLSCLQGQTDIAGLKAINRPVVSSIVMPDGEHVFGVVESIVDDGTHETITFSFSGRTLTMNAKAFRLRWSGDYWALWSPPSHIKRNLKFGHQGEDVKELRRLLALAGYGDGANDQLNKGSSFFGPSLRNKIHAFQEDQGLTKDGVANPETLMRITGLAKATQIPTIYRNKG